MLAIIYLFVIALFGCSLIRMLIPDIRRFFVASAVNKKVLSHIPDQLFIIPAGTVVGILLVNFANYLILYGVSLAIPDHTACKNISLILTVALFLYLTIVTRKAAHRFNDKNVPSQQIPAFNGKYGNIVYYGISIVVFTLFASFLYFYSYRLSGNNLMVGYSVFSDLSPHTSMITSFSTGFNMPTHYMHFADDGIQYHFLFYYFCGMLQYLGLSIDCALNIASIISMVSTFILLGLIAVLLSGKRISFILPSFLVLFRSSMNIFTQINKLTKIPGTTLIDAVKALSHSSGWADVTPYDSWGIWAVNVYANQRHLMFGAALILVLVLIFIPYVRRMSVAITRCDSFKSKIFYFFCSRNAWIWRSQDSLNPAGTLILSMLIVGSMPYYHGSCLIAALLVLLGMAVVSESRLIYLACATVAVGSSFVQTRLFSGSASKVVKFTFCPGFILGKVSASELISYLIQVTGVTLIIAVIVLITMLIFDLVKHRPLYRFFLGISFALPFVFAFLFQVSIEMLANHKFIQISLILLDIFVAVFISNLLVIPFKIRTDEIPEVEYSPSPHATFMPPAAAVEETPTPAEVATEESDDVPEAAASVDTETETEVVVEAAIEATISETATESELTSTVENEDSIKRIALPVNPLFEKDNTQSSEAQYVPSTTVSKPRHKGIPLSAYIALQVVSILLVLALLVPLFGTGLSEWCVYYNLNKWNIHLDTRSELVEWIINNTDDQDVFLTPEWSMNRFVLCGRAMYYGWPYYAYSAGHDTFTRDEVYRWLIRGCDGDVDAFVNYCKSRNIRYVIADPEFDDSAAELGQFDWFFFASNFPQAAYFANDNNTIVYKIY
ncbi:MAG: hypothetical protein MJ153_08465 [Clostridia bacterium]|nr:hypothetical protein [Clostridia bacterium]